METGPVNLRDLYGLELFWVRYSTQYATVHVLKETPK